MTSCPDCDRASTNPRTSIYSTGCISCEARALAQGTEATQRERDPDALQAAMRKLWPVVSDYRRGRTLFWAWVAKLEASKG